MFKAGTRLESSAAKCFAKHSRPLDETTLQIQIRHFEPFAFDNFDIAPDKAIMRNTGNMLLIDLDYNGDIPPTIYGGAVAEFGNYSLARVSWYWLEKSQPKYDFHQIKFPAELHLIFFNAKNKNLPRAAVRKNSVIALTFPLKVCVCVILEIYYINIKF